MNWDQIQGNWKQFKGNAKQQWAKLTDDDLNVIAGKRDVLSGKIQEMYGTSKEQTEKQLSAWQAAQTGSTQFNEHTSAKDPQIKKSDTKTP